MACQSTIPINFPQMIEKGNKLAKDLGQNDSVAMASWIQQFKMHKGIESKVTCGEFTATDPAVEINWRRKLGSLLEGYSPDCIYNADDTGLFYRCLPCKSHSNSLR